jgi:hypothetical protein
MFAVEVAAPPLVTPENATLRQNDQTEESIPPMMPELFVVPIRS